MSDGLAILIRNNLRILANIPRIIAGHSRFKVIFITSATTLLALGLFGFFFEGFKFLHSLGGVGLMLIDGLFSVFFWGISILMVFSGFITAFYGLFRSPEMPWLLTHPLREGDIVLYKTVQATVLSSWAYFFIVIPFLTAYALHEHLSPLFMLWAVLFSVPFLALCSAIGVLVCLLIVRWIPLWSGLRLAALVALLPLVWWIKTYFDLPDGDQEGAMFMMARMIPGMRVAALPLWPSYWLSSGIMSMAGGRSQRGLMYMLVLISNAGVIFYLTGWLGQRTFYNARARMLTPRRKKHRHAARFELERWLIGVPHAMRGLLAKDFRIFFRDPAQWTQGLIFFALLGFYFINLRAFNYDRLEPVWRNLVGFINVFSVASVTCAVGCRFVYPQLSLEGQAFWVVGMAPHGMRRTLISKFIAATIALVGISTGLMLISSIMLKAGPRETALLSLITAALALSVAGLSTGLGAIFMDLEERNPAAVFSSFGGTLNLILCLLLLFLVIVPFGAVFHLSAINEISLHQLHVTTALLLTGLILLTASSVGFPLVIGLHILHTREY